MLWVRWAVDGRIIMGGGAKGDSNLLMEVVEEQEKKNDTHSHTHTLILRNANR